MSSRKRARVYRIEDDGGHAVPEMRMHVLRSLQGRRVGAELQFVSLDQRVEPTKQVPQVIEGSTCESVVAAPEAVKEKDGRRFTQAVRSFLNAISLAYDSRRKKCQSGCHYGSCTLMNSSVMTLAVRYPRSAHDAHGLL